MNHEAINQRIQALESELAGLKAELNKPEKFNFKYAQDNTFLISVTYVDNNQKCIGDVFFDNFRCRKTETNAQADFQLQKELMCIGALAEQIDPDYKNKVNWNFTYSGKYFISYDVKKNTYISFMRDTHRELGVVYMPKDVALKVCEILNNKQVEL